MDLRPQAHDIIRTWLFSTVLRSQHEENVLPWANTAISGWVLDPDRKKMSKSKGNVVTPMGLLEEHGSDAVRYWAAKGGPGVDTAFDSGQMKVGRRLAIKLLNASKFVLAKAGESGAISEPLDRGMLWKLSRLVEHSSRHLDVYDYASALRETEEFFWWFCDDYIELVKRRRAADGPASQSATIASGRALSVILRLFAPFLPFVTDEVWSWSQRGTVHRAPWPTRDEVTDRMAGDREGADTAASRIASEVTARIRQERSARKLGFSVTARLALVLPETDRIPWDAVASDVIAGNNIIGIDVSNGDALSATLDPQPADA